MRVAAALQPRSSMGDGLDYQRGKRPDTRMVGNDLVLVFPITGTGASHPHVHLVLRIDPQGELFAALSRPPLEDPT